MILCGFYYPNENQKAMKIIINYEWNMWNKCLNENKSITEHSFSENVNSKDI